MIRQIIFFKIFIILGFVPVANSMCPSSLFREMAESPPYVPILFDKEHSISENLQTLVENSQYGLKIKRMQTHPNINMRSYSFYKILDTTGTSNPIYFEVSDYYGTRFTIQYCGDKDMSQELLKRRFFRFMFFPRVWDGCTPGFDRSNVNHFNGHFDLSDQRAILEEIYRRQPYDPVHEATAAE